MFPGYPAWLLATGSYLLSDDGISGRNCIDGDGCNTNCGRFIPPPPPPSPFNLFPVAIGGFCLVCVHVQSSCTDTALHVYNLRHTLCVNIIACVYIVHNDLYVCIRLCRH